MFNVGGSVKDLVAMSMINDAEERGALLPGGKFSRRRRETPALAWHSSVSVERRKLLKAYGAELTLVDGSTAAAVKKAQEIHTDHPEYFYASQFTNPANPRIHEQTTGPEIIQTFEKQGLHVDCFVSGVGTGGTITGVGHALRKAYGDSVAIIAVEPDASPVLSGGSPGPHKIQGIGAGFIPEVLDRTVYNEVYRVSYEDALQKMTICGTQEGLHVGVSAGAALHAAVTWAKQAAASSHSTTTTTSATTTSPASATAPLNVVVVLPDTGERYLSLVDSE
ncbi:cysteine synthase A [Pelomyxa schiedti]|nr:cysteine synthase A [Pelomyxa schiedti]